MWQPRPTGRAASQFLRDLATANIHVVSLRQIYLMNMGRNQATDLEHS